MYIEPNGHLNIIFEYVIRCNLIGYDYYTLFGADNLVANDFIADVLVVIHTT